MMEAHLNRQTYIFRLEAGIHLRNEKSKMHDRKHGFTGLHLD